MNLKESLAMALDSIAANKLRAGLTMLGVIIGVGAVITMLAISTGVREKILGDIRSMGTNVLFVRSGEFRHGPVRGGAGSVETLTLGDAEAILLGSPSVEKVAPEVSSRAQVEFGNTNTNTNILGAGPDYAAIRNFEVAEGRFIEDGDVRIKSKVAVLGPTAAESLFGEGGSPLGQRIRIRGIQFQVVGLLKPKGAAGFGDPDDQIIIPVTTAMDRVFGRDALNSISVQVRQMRLMPLAEAEIEAVLRQRHRLQPGAPNDFNIRSQSEIMEMATEMTGVFALLLGSIASVSLLVGGIGIMNIMLVSVTERTREIGIRMALGARRRDIRAQFLVESVALSLLGGLAGILAGAGSSILVSRFTTWDAVITPWSVALAFGFAALVGVFFGYYPARKASMLDPIEALRYE